jgi:DHA3 family macrolide efflux protein-like MFS transporter
MIGKRGLRSPQYTRVFLGQCVSQFGTGFSYIALMAKFQGLADSPSAWPFLAAAKGLPFALFGVLLGYLTDRFDRRKVLFVADFCRFWLYLAIAGCSSLRSLYVLVFLSSIFEAAYLPAYRSLVTTLLDPDELLAANSMEETVRSLVNIGGVAASGVLVSLAGVRLCFCIDATTYLVSAINMLLIPALQGYVGGNTEGALKVELFRGMRLIRTTRALFLPLLVSTLVTFLIAFEAPLFFPLVTEKGWGGAAATGYIFAAVCVGSLLSSLCLLRHDRSPITTARGVALILLLDAACLVGVVWPRPFIAALVLSFGLGVTETCFRTFSVTRIQEVVPAEALGRVFATTSMLHEPLKILCMLAAGALLQVTTAQMALFSAAAMELVCALALFLVTRR